MFLNVAKEKVRVHRVCLLHCRTNQQWMPLLRCQRFVTLVKTDKKIKNKAFTEIVEITLKNNKMKQLSCAALQYNKKMNGEFI